MTQRNLTISTLLTLAVGAAIGVLIAPASGRETRRRLMEKGSSAKDTLHYLLMEAGDLVDQLRNMVGEFSGPDHSHIGNGHHRKAPAQGRE
jgi:gas vesicle protein